MTCFTSSCLCDTLMYPWNVYISTEVVHAPDFQSWVYFLEGQTIKCWIKRILLYCPGIFFWRDWRKPLKISGCTIYGLRYNPLDLPNIEAGVLITQPWLSHFLFLEEYFIYCTSQLAVGFMSWMYDACLFNVCAPCHWLWVHHIEVISVCIFEVNNWWIY